MKIKILKYGSFLFLAIFSFSFYFEDVAMAAIQNEKPATFTAIVCKIKELILYSVPFFVALAVVLFLVGLAKYVGNGDNEEKRTEGTKLMVYGILGLFVIVAVWGLVSIVTGTFGIKIGIPQFEGNGTTYGC